MLVHIFFPLRDFPCGGVRRPVAAAVELRLSFASDTIFYLIKMLF